MKNEESQRKFCIVMSVIGIILSTLAIPIEYFIMKKIDSLWIILLIVNIIILLINLFNTKK